MGLEVGMTDKWGGNCVLSLAFKGPPWNLRRMKKV